MTPNQENPYRSPSGADQRSTATLRERLTCPACGEYSVPVWEAYIRSNQELYHIARCRDCGSKLVATKSWLSRLLVIALIIPTGIFGGAALLNYLDPTVGGRLGAASEYASFPAFFAVAVAVMVFDFFISRYSLRVKFLDEK